MAKLDDLIEKRVTAVPSELNQDLVNIAQNTGITKSQFLRKEIRAELNDMEPRYLIKGDEVTLFLCGVNPSLNSKINAIAKDMGVAPSSLLKMILYKIANKYPENMKKPNKGLNIKD